jgi:hypothetical protein
VADVRRLWDQDLPDEDWVVRFLKAVGSDPDALPPELIAAAVPLVPFVFLDDEGDIGAREAQSVHESACLRVVGPDTGMRVDRRGSRSVPSRHRAGLA